MGVKKFFIYPRKNECTPVVIQCNSHAGRNGAAGDTGATGPQGQDGFERRLIITIDE